MYANACVTERPHFFEHSYDQSDLLQEPSRNLNNENWNGVLLSANLARHSMRHHKKHGSIIITTSATSSFPEQSFQVYASGNTAIIGLIRAHCSPSSPATS